MSLKRPISIALSLVLAFLPVASAVAQQKRQTSAKPPATPAAKPTPVPTPPPTFDTLLAADSYKVYVEVRSVGQLIRSNSVNEILEPIMKLAAPPKEFRTVIKWLNTHADDVMTSRLFVASWPAPGTEVPGSLVAIEFASAEDAAKFQQKLNQFLDKMLPPAAPESSPKPIGPTGDNAQSSAEVVEVVRVRPAPKESPAQAEPPAPTEPPVPSEPPAPPYHMQQAGSLILITPTPLKLNKLRRAGSKLLSEDANFRMARNRFNTESIFLFVDIGEIENEEAEQQKKWEEQRKQAVAAVEENQEAIEKAKEEIQKQMEKEEVPQPPEEGEIVGKRVELNAVGTVQDSKDAKPESPPAVLMALGMLFANGSIADAKWPEAIGVGFSLDGESFDVRALMVNKPGEKSDPIPFFPILAPGPAIIPEASNILPADTEMLVSFSLDLPQIYTMLSTPRQLEIVPTGGTQPSKSEFEPVLPSIEKQLKIKIKDDLLPLLGSEVAIGVPLTEFSWMQPPPSASPSPSPSSSASPSASPNANANEAAPEQSKTPRAPAVVISLKDKEGMRTLLPKLIEAAAFKGANSFAQTERREDTELVSYANLLAYAFIGNYLVISPDAAATRHVVDSYLNHQTLAGDINFKNYARWQPRQLQGQIYISPALMESYRKWALQPGPSLDDQTRAFLTRFSIVPQPVTYSLSNDGFGPLHELHLPKNLVLLLIAAAAGGMGGTPANPPPAATPANPSNPF